MLMYLVSVPSHESTSCYKLTLCVGSPRKHTR